VQSRGFSVQRCARYRKHVIPLLFQSVMRSTQQQYGRYRCKHFCDFGRAFLSLGQPDAWRAMMDMTVLAAFIEYSPNPWSSRIIAGSSPEQDPRSDSSTSTMLPSPLPESSYYVVSTKANLPSDPLRFKDHAARYLEHCPRCIDQSLSRTLLCPSKILAPRAECARYQKHVIPLLSQSVIRSTR
jgi:hypothetical protein